MALIRSKGNLRARSIPMVTWITVSHPPPPPASCSLLTPPTPLTCQSSFGREQCGARSRRLMWAAAIHSRVNLSEAGSLYSQRDMLCRHVYTSFPLRQSSSLACQ
ncbi:hypothetical protein Q7C36_018183 [Tachysurus vachellii]|uniref:Uncharacterized protein n=1 Tax=Tachysurus vachellii TaxID=175792 RepID=A0AA88LZG4_TACVA|nr:hypothetical protein Q7C36_018183 [Tachysurus vachellii]